MEEMPLPKGVFHSAQEFEFLEAVPYNSDLDVHIAVERRAERAGALYTTVAIELRLDDRPVCRGKATVVLPPSRVEASAGATG